MPTCHTVGSRSIYLGVPPRMVLSNPWVDQLHCLYRQFSSDNSTELPHSHFSSEIKVAATPCTHFLSRSCQSCAPCTCPCTSMVSSEATHVTYLSSCTSLGPETRTPDVNEYLLYRSSRPRGREARTQRSIKKCLNSKARIVSRLHIPSTLMNFCSEICGDE